MTHKRKPAKKPSRRRAEAARPRTQPVQRQRTTIRVRRHRQGDCWELVHPSDVVERNAPLRRNVTIDDVGNVAAFLLSDLAAGVTSEITYVDAGFSQVMSGVELQPTQG